MEIPEQSGARRDDAIDARLTRLEGLVGDLVAALSAGAGPSAAGSTADAAGAASRDRGTDPAPMARVTRLAPDAVRELEGGDASDPGRREGDRRQADPEADDPLWALDGLRSRSGGSGAVLYTAAVETGLGRIEYQWSRPTEQILERDLGRAAQLFAALGHPVRLEMLRLLLDGERTVAQLVADLDLGSNGVAYHHLQQLEAAGWVRTTGRGRRAIPPSRVAALLTAILTTEEG